MYTHSKHTRGCPFVACFTLHFTAESFDSVKKIPFLSLHCRNKDNLLNIFHFRKRYKFPRAPGACYSTHMKGSIDAYPNPPFGHSISDQRRTGCNLFTISFETVNPSSAALLLNDCFTHLFHLENLSNAITRPLVIFCHNLCRLGFCDDGTSCCSVLAIAVIFGL